MTVDPLAAVKEKIRVETDERFALARRVEVWFADAVRGSCYSVPSFGESISIATRILTIKAHASRPKFKNSLLRYSQIYLKHLNEEKRRVEQTLGDLDFYGCFRTEVATYRAILKKIDAARLAVEAVRPPLLSSPQWRDPFDFVAEGARLAWGNTGGQVPGRQSRVMIKFMQSALGEVPTKTRPNMESSVRDRLRGRRGAKTVN